MHITAQHRYNASPDQILAMMADEAWLTEVARRSGAEQWKTWVDADGSHVQASMSAPSRVERFTGALMRIELTLMWRPLSSDGTSSGQIKVATPGMPASLSGTAQVSPDGDATVVDYQADFSISLPLVGKKLEQTAVPYVRRVIDIQQSVGNDYLSSRLDK